MPFEAYKYHQRGGVTATRPLLRRRALPRIRPAAFVSDYVRDMPQTVTEVGAGTAWTNPNKIKVYDSDFAYVTLNPNADSKILRLTNFDFSAMPDNAVICGVRVRLHHFRTDAKISLATVQIVDQGTPVGNSRHAEFSSIPISPAPAEHQTVGETDSLAAWGAGVVGMTTAAWKAATSGVDLVAHRGPIGVARAYHVDYCRLIVWYQY